MEYFQKIEIWRGLLCQFKLKQIYYKVMSTFKLKFEGFKLNKFSNLLLMSGLLSIADGMLTIDAASDPKVNQQHQHHPDHNSNDPLL